MEHERFIAVAMQEDTRRQPADEYLYMTSSRTPRSPSRDSPQDGPGPASPATPRRTPTCINYSAGRVPVDPEPMQRSRSSQQEPDKEPRVRTLEESRAYAKAVAAEHASSGGRSRRFSLSDPSRM